MVGIACARELARVELRVAVCEASGQWQAAPQVLPLDISLRWPIPKLIKLVQQQVGIAANACVQRALRLRARTAPAPWP